MKQKLLVPIDGSQPSLRGLDVAIGLARTMDADIVLVHVVDNTKVARLSYGEPSVVEPLFEELRQEGERYLAEAEAAIKSGIVTSSQVAYGNPADEIGKIASEIGASMIVMGSHGRTGLRHLLMGSVAEGVIRNAKVPVVIVPAHADDNGAHHAAA